MKTFIKSTSILLALIMALSIFAVVPFGASAAEVYTDKTGEESGTTGDCTWTFEDGVLTISGNGAMGDYYYDESVPWYSYRYSIVEVKIENGVTNIGSYAFRNCIELTSITISDSVTSIGQWAFASCSRLTSIDIPDSVTSIGMGAFSYAGLTSITIPASVTSIIGNVFYGCTGLTSIVVDTENQKYDSRNNCNAIIDTVTDELVSGCSSTIIPDSVTSIGSSAFNGCTELTSITIPDSVTSICSDAFYGCPGLMSITIPDSVISIDNEAFANCTGLTSVTIGNSVKRIDSFAFRDCTGLTSIDIPDSVTSIGASAFSDCTGLTSVTISNSVTSIGNQVFENCTRLTNVTIGNSVNSISFSAFKGCVRLTSINIPDSVTSIGSSAFSGCKGLTSIDIPDSVTSIGSSAFNCCTGLTSVKIGNSVTSVGSEAFWGCVGLTSINIPGSVTSIRVDAFYGCTGLTSITISDSFKGNVDWLRLTPSITDVNISVNELETFCGGSCSNIKSAFEEKNYHLFMNGEPLTDIYIPDSVTSIEFSVFSHFAEISSIHIPKYLREISPSGFCDCNGLTSITVDPENKKFDSRDNCNAIIDKKSNELLLGCKSTVIPDSVTSIGSSAFENCTSLTGITIPKSVTSIGSYAFENCTSLTSVTIPNSVADIGDKALGYYKDEEGNYKNLDGFTIYGYEDSAADDYAWNNLINFVKLTEEPTEPVTTESTEPATAEPTEPATTEPAQPVTDTPTEPVETQPTTDKPTEQTEPISTEPAQPSTDNPTDTQPASEPVKPTENPSAKTDISDWNVSGIKEMKYTGKVIKQDNILVEKDGEYADFTVEYRNNVEVGTVSVTIIGIGNYTGEIYKSFKITKANNPVKVTAKKTVNAKTKKKTVIKKAITVKNAQGKVTYKTNNKKVKVKNGIITVAKGLKKGKTVKVKITITAKGNDKYKPKKIVKTIKIKVK